MIVQNVNERGPILFEAKTPKALLNKILAAYRKSCKNFNLAEKKVK